MGKKAATHKKTFKPTHGEKKTRAERQQARAQKDLEPPKTVMGKLRKIAFDSLHKHYDGNKSDFAKSFGVSRSFVNRQVCYSDQFNTFDALPKLSTASAESSLDTVVMECYQLFPFPVKFSALTDAVSSRIKGKAPQPDRIRQVLHDHGLRVKQAKNVANARNPTSMKNRVDRVTTFFEELDALNIPSILDCDDDAAFVCEDDGDTMDLLFFDECNLNQKDLDSDEYIAPPGVTVYKPHHYGTHTESLSLLLVVNHRCEIVYMELKDKSVSTNWAVAQEFLLNCLKSDKCPKKIKPTIYMDNFGAHKKAFNEYKKKQPGALMDKRMDPVWAASCTPELNLAEYFFGDYNSHLRKALSTNKSTMRGKAWLEFNREQIEKWSKSHTVKKDTFVHVQRYAKELLECKGDLQLLALKKVGIESYRQIEENFSCSSDDPRVE